MRSFQEPAALTCGFSRAVSRDPKMHTYAHSTHRVQRGACADLPTGHSRSSSRLTAAHSYDHSHTLTRASQRAAPVDLERHHRRTVGPRLILSGRHERPPRLPRPWRLSPGATHTLRTSMRRGNTGDMARRLFPASRRMKSTVPTTAVCTLVVRRDQHGRVVEQRSAESRASTRRSNASAGVEFHRLAHEPNGTLLADKGGGFAHGADNLVVFGPLGR